MEILNGTLAGRLPGIAKVAPTREECPAVTPFIDETLDELHAAEQASVADAFRRAQHHGGAVEGLGAVLNALERQEAQAVVVHDGHSAATAGTTISRPADVVVAAAARKRVGLRVVNDRTLAEGVGAFVVTTGTATGWRSAR